MYTYVHYEIQDPFMEKYINWKSNHYKSMQATIDEMFQFVNENISEYI